MAGRKGAIAFGLVYIPVELYPATQDDAVRFNQLAKESMQRVRYVKTCPDCNRELGPDDIVRGYQYEKGKYVVVSDEELDAIKTDADRAMKIVQFVDLQEVPPVYFEKPYQVRAQPGGEKPLELLRLAMVEEGKAAIGTTVLGMFLTVMAAYALSRKDFIWANPLMLIISFTMLFSGGIVTLYILVTQTLNMYDSRWALILPNCMSAFYLILVRTAMQNVPDSLEESAMLDGAGRFTILFQIMLPLIKATLATVILYYVIGNWNSWFNAMIYIRSEDKKPLQLILKELLVDTNSSSNANVDISVLASGESGDAVLYKQLMKYCTIMVSTVPMFIFYPFIQKYFESGVMIGAIKG